MRFIQVVAASVALAGPALAQDNIVERYKDRPIEEAFTALEQEGQTVPRGVFYMQVRKALADLLYPVDLRTPFDPLTDADTVAAIRTFEEKIGATADGVLTLREFERLVRFSFLADVTPLSPGSGFSVNSYEGNYPGVFASGSWSMPDLAWPLNRVRIVCWISENTCEETTTDVWAPAIAGSQADTTRYLLNTDTSSYQIARWENGILDAVTDSTCRRITLSINVRTKLVTQTAQDLTSEGCAVPGTGVRLDPIRELRVATLIDTFEAQSAFEKERREAVAAVQGPLAASIDAAVAAVQGTTASGINAAASPVPSQGT
jgi:hypothetical protein